MTTNEALGESLQEISSCGPEHPSLKMVLDQQFLESVLGFIGKCAQAGTPIEQVVLSAMAVGITIGRKVPVVEN